MKIIIFGGGGFIGSAIVDRLLLDEHDIRIFERPRVEPYRKFLDHEKVSWVTGDILNVNDLRLALDNRDLVIHLVSTTLPKGSNEDPIYDVQSNLIGTLQILDAIVAMNIKKIIFISSGGTVYGRPKYLPIDEKHPCEPEVSYGITKHAIENYLLLYKKIHGISTVILRVANPFGKRQRIETAQGAASAFIYRAITGRPIEVWGDGSVRRDYIYIDDVANAFASAVTYEGDKTIFNISRGQGTSLNELISTIEDVVGYRIKKEYLPARNFDLPTSILSNNLAKEELDWAPKTSLFEGIKITSEWMRNQSIVAK